MNRVVICVIALYVLSLQTVAGQDLLPEWEPKSDIPLSAHEFVLTCSKAEIEFRLGLSPPPNWLSEAKLSGTIIDVVPLSSGGKWQRISWGPVTIGYFSDEPAQIFEISTTSQDCVTCRGISVGSSFQDLSDVYGDLLQRAPGRSDTNVFAILSDDPIHGYDSDLYLLEFFVSDGIVTRILLRIPI